MLQHITSTRKVMLKHNLQAKESSRFTIGGVFSVLQCGRGMNSA